MIQKRRVFMVYVASTGVSLCAPSVYAEFPALKETEAAAQEHGYRVNATQVDTKKYPQYKEGQSCANCQIYEELSKNTGNCALFPERTVSLNGWCDVWG